jgi:hypothetical protein
MRRALSIPAILLTLFLALSLGAEPVWAAVPQGGLASGWTGQVDESKLPACCRRHGAHHCDMAGYQPGDHETAISSTGCCPSIPRALASNPAPFATLAAPDSASALFVERHSPQAAVISAGISERRGWPKRGPPALA